MHTIHRSRLLRPVGQSLSLAHETHFPVRRSAAEAKQRVYTAGGMSMDPLPRDASGHA